MKIVIIGSTGTIGRHVVKLLSRDHEIVKVALRDADFQADIKSKASIERLFQEVRPFDAVVSAAGIAKFGTLDELTEEDYTFGLMDKLMGQVKLVLIGRNYINDEGSFTLTSGMLSQNPIPGSSSVSMVNAGVEGFVRAAALEMKHGIRVNAVSPVFVNRFVGFSRFVDFFEESQQKARNYCVKFAFRYRHRRTRKDTEIQNIRHANVTQSTLRKREYCWER